MARTDPAGLTPGAPITWTQYDPGGGNYVRTGIVLDRAPIPPTQGRGSRAKTPGVTLVWWVMPDQADERDAYPILAVGKATRGHQPHGEDTNGTQHVSKGELFASWCSASPTGSLTARAGRR